jgi:hypothetical protein
MQSPRLHMAAEINLASMQHGQSPSTMHLPTECDLSQGHQDNEQCEQSVRWQRTASGVVQVQQRADLCLWYSTLNCCE